MEVPAEKQEAAHNLPTVAGLFVSFLRLGATAFGGPAMIAYIRDLSVNRKGWIDQEGFKDGLVLSQSIPGPTVTHTAAYVGLRTRGLAGALAAYVGFGFPAFLFMLGFSALYAASRSLPWTSSVFSGLQVIVTAIVAHATFTFGKSSLRHYVHAILAAASAAAFGLGASPFYVILGAACAGILFLSRKGNQQTTIADRKDFPGVVPSLGLMAVLVLGLLSLYLFSPKLFSLALVMCKVNIFAFGGGFASLPLMLQEVVNVRGWLDERTFMDGIALGQVTPGPIITTATFVGYLTNRLFGAVVATIAVFAPSFIILVLTAPFFNRLKASPVFSKATRGILASFVGLLLFVTVKFAFAVPWDLFRVILVLATLAALLKKVDLLYIVLIGAALSLLVF